MGEQALARTPARPTRQVEKSARICRSLTRYLRKSEKAAVAAHCRVLPHLHNQTLPSGDVPSSRVICDKLAYSDKSKLFAKPAPVGASQPFQEEGDIPRTNILDPPNQSMRWV